MRVLGRDSWNARQTRWLRAYFRNEIMPVLSPLGLDPAHPFPKILNKSLNIVVVLKGKDAFGRAGHLAIVRAPRSLPRIIHLPQRVSGGEHDFVFLSSVLSAFVDELFPGMEVKGAYQFRVTRNSELVVDEEEVENLALALRDELVGRGYKPAVRLEIAKDCPQADRAHAAAELRAAGERGLPHRRPGQPQPRDPGLRPGRQAGTQVPAVHPAHAARTSTRCSRRWRDGDVLLHHPFDAFTPVLELIEQAADDPNVLAIKQTLYRTGKDSAIVDALIQAARNGKDVTVVVELRARFDEDANLGLADRLQEAGVQVVYGVVGFKTHAKMLLIVRREGRKLRRYVHLGTGNYHSGTARAYTDLGLITADPDIGNDVHLLFQQLSGLAPSIKLKRLLQSPFTLHAGLLKRIEREAKLARAGKPGRIIAKMNALNEPRMIRALYAASQAGVQIDLIVRGACALATRGARRVRTTSACARSSAASSNTAASTGSATTASPNCYCASADWLERNLLRRVETCFPILDPETGRARVRGGAGELPGRQLQRLGTRRRRRLPQVSPAEGEAAYSAQAALLAKV